MFGVFAFLLVYFKLFFVNFKFVFFIEATTHPTVNQLSLVLASGLASIISSSLTQVLQCRLEADIDVRNCLLK